MNIQKQLTPQEKSTPTSPDREPTEHQDTDPILLPAPSRWLRFWNWAQFALCVILAAGLLAYLLWTRDSGAHNQTDDQRSSSKSVVHVVGPNIIRIQGGCPLCQKLHISDVQITQITDPILMVTGTVFASLRPGEGKGKDHWQFSSSELLTTFTDWQKAKSDIDYSEMQRKSIEEGGKIQVSAKEKKVERLKKLVAAGTDTEKDLAEAQAELFQAQITSRKDNHEAENAVRLAKRTEAALARQLQQVGLDQKLLLDVTSEVDIVVADVPEGFVSRVKLGQKCKARFFGLPDRTFDGEVQKILPVLNKERRSLRVLFKIFDKNDQLRLGMFADIGLGTDKRDTKLIPPDAVVHVGLFDYVLVSQGGEHWRVTKVKVGELHDGGIEILDGLKTGDQVASKCVILLKPFMIQALQRVARKE